LAQIDPWEQATRIRPTVGITVVAQTACSDSCASTPVTGTPTGGGPGFTSSSAATAAHAFRFTVTTTGDPAPRITRTGRLPSGVTFMDLTNGTATISGTPQRSREGVPADPDRQEQVRDRDSSVHPGRHRGPGHPEDHDYHDYHDQGGRCAAAHHPGHGIPAANSK
jgi:hypothetical protein